jgi:hypothetical protein
MAGHIDWKDKTNFATLRNSNNHYLDSVAYLLTAFKVKKLPWYKIFYYRIKRWLRRIIKKIKNALKKWRKSEPEYGNWASLHEHLLPIKNKKFFDIHLKNK